MGAQITTNKVTGTEANFKIALNQNANWKQLRINFLSTTRTDLEIGSVAAVPGDSPLADTFSLKYSFKNKWSESDLLKYKVFLSGFDLGSDANIIKIYLEKTDITESALMLRFTTKGTQTRINGLNVDVVIFNAYNPAFRYAEGVISQNFLKTKLSI